MDKLKKATNILSIIDIILCLITIAFSLLFDALVDVLHFPWDYLTWMLLILSALSLLAIVLFVLVLIIHGIRCKKIIKEKSVIIAHVLNIIFVALIFVFIDKLDLWFIFC